MGQGISGSREVNGASRFARERAVAIMSRGGGCRGDRDRDGKGLVWDGREVERKGGDAPWAGEVESEGGRARDTAREKGWGSIRPGGANGAREGSVRVWAISRVRATGLGKAGQVNAMATGKEKPLGLSKLANLVTAVIPGQSAVASRLRVNIEADGTGGIGGGG